MTTIRARSIWYWLLTASLLCPALSAAQRQGLTDLPTLAANVAEAIRKSPEKNTEASPVRVLDFVERYTEPTELAHEIASRFADLLRKDARGFEVLDTDGLRRRIANPKVPPTAFDSPSWIRCYASELGDTMLVEGTLRVAPDGVVLNITVWSAKARKSIFDESGIVPLTPSMEELAKKPASSIPLPDFSTHEHRLWVNPKRPPVPDEQTVEPNQLKGYTVPKCIRCTNPNFSGDAVAAKLQGTVLLKGQILADGSLTRLVLLKGLPCGLTDRAFEAAETWTFEPARKIDGTPVSVDVPLEVIFRLY
jgi:Gram-negative bacterial TonB protein C-terminal